MSSMKGCPETSFDSSFRSSGLGSPGMNYMTQTHLSVGFYTRRTYDVGQGGAAALIAPLCCGTCYTYSVVLA